MPDETGGQDPAGDANHKGLSVAPSNAITEQRKETSNTGNKNADQRTSETKKLAKELHWLEKANFSAQIILAIVGIIAVIIYHGQLDTMRGTLAEMQRSGEASTKQVWRAIDNLNWQAHSMDDSSKQTGRAVDLTQRQSQAALAETKESNAINRESLISVQRAFVTFSKNLNATPVIDSAHNSVIEWDFRPILENSGVTPARHAMHHFTMQPFPSDLPADFAFPSGNAETRPFVLGPKQSATGALLKIQPAELLFIQKMHCHLYFWGWVTYYDIFPSTRQHISMFCTAVTGIHGDPTKAGTPLTLDFEECDRHNCNDEDCNGAKGDPRKKQPVTSSQ